MLLFESGDTGVFKDNRNKLFTSNSKQNDNHTFILDMLYSPMSVVCTEATIEEVYLRRLFGVAVVLC